MKIEIVNKHRANEIMKKKSFIMKKKKREKKIRFRQVFSLSFCQQKSSIYWNDRKKMNSEVFIDEMTKNEESTSRSVHRVDLSLPVVQTDSYEIFYDLPGTLSTRLTSKQKPLVEINKKTINQSTRIRSPARLKHLIGPVFVNLMVDMAAMTNESSSTMGDTISNAITNSTSSNRILKGLLPLTKRNKLKPIKDDGDRSQSSSGQRLLYESLGSFDDCSTTKTKYSNMWQNTHHPQLTTSKALHIRKTAKQSLTSNPVQSKVSNSMPFDNLSQGSMASMNEQLHEKIEQLTKTYFPAIQQIRHARPTPELLNNRMHLHRDQKRNFMPVLSRTRIVR